jgi:hypothetical protein
MQTLKRSLPAVTRTALGLIFTVFGLNGFLNFIPQPPAPEAAAAFGGALAATGYMFPLLKSTEIISGLLLLTGRYVPLALTVLAPIIVNIVAFHAFLAPGGLGIAFFVLAAELALAWWYRDAFRTVLASRVEPRVPSSTAQRALSAPVTSRA